VTSLSVIGAGKFAVEVSGYLGDAFQIERFVALPAEPVHAPADRCLALDDFRPSAGTRVVLAVSDVAVRRRLIDGFIEKHGLVAENIVHPSARIDARQIGGAGNIIGPDCYFGANVLLGGYNVVNYHCSVGHHSRVGSNNFVAPNFHCGNSVTIGDNNMFGLSCTVAPEVTIGDDSRFQAGITLFEDAPSGRSYLTPNRVKSIPSL